MKGVPPRISSQFDHGCTHVISITNTNTAECSYFVVLLFVLRNLKVTFLLLYYDLETVVFAIIGLLLPYYIIYVHVVCWNNDLLVL